MSVQQPSPGHQYGPIIVAGGAAHLGDQHITIYQDEEYRQERQRQQLLASLRFPEMNARYNEIKDTQYETFEWVFDQAESHDHVQHSSLAKWFKEQHGTHLIQGKAGSGKSTFMKFLFEHTKTKVLLQQWSADHGLLMLFHSFWMVGTSLQHNFKGLLANLVYQVAQTCPEIVAQYCAQRPLKTCLNDWSDRELQGALLHCAQASKLSACIFLDGLDEFDHSDEVERLFRLLSDVGAASGAAWKFCVSTRPVQYILDRFRLGPTTRLHELTAADIRKYAITTLEEVGGAGRYSIDEMDYISRLICDKADGVFLWVYYALRNVCKGLRIEDEFYHLQQRLQDLPSAIEDLYRRMWQMQNADNAIHAEESRHLFHLVYTFHVIDHENRPALPLFQLLIASEPHLRAEYLSSLKTLDEDRLESLSLRFARKVGSRSAGLIECVETRNSYEICDYRMFEPDLTGWKYDIVRTNPRPWRKMKIQFIHRTVLDFLADTMEGRSIAGLTENPREIPLRALLEARLICFVESVLPLCLDELVFLSTEMGSIGPKDVDFVDVFEKTIVGLLSERFGQATTAVSVWTRLDRDLVCRDISELIMHNSESVLCVEYLLTTRGHGWTGYYKGYLFLLTFKAGMLHTLNRNQLEAMTLLHNAGADLTTPRTFLYPSESCAITRSSASELLSCLVETLMYMKIDPSSSRYYLPSLKELADTFLKHKPGNGQITFARHARMSARFSNCPFLSHGDEVLITLNAAELSHAVCNILDRAEWIPQWLDIEEALLATVELVHVLVMTHHDSLSIARCGLEEGLHLTKLAINLILVGDEYHQKLKAALGKVDTSRFIPLEDPHCPTIPDLDFKKLVETAPLDQQLELRRYCRASGYKQAMYYGIGGQNVPRFLNDEPDDSRSQHLNASSTALPDDHQDVQQKTLSNIHKPLCTHCHFHDSVD